MTASRFFFWGAAIQFVFLALFQIGDVAWTDILHHNPYRTRTETLEMMAAEPLFALISVALFSEGWLAVAAVVAGWTRRRLNRLPVAVLLVLVPLCVAAYTVQRTWIWPPDDPDNAMQWQIMVASEAFFVIPALLVAWWRDRLADRKRS